MSRRISTKSTTPTLTTDMTPADAVREARRMYARVLSSWACDCLLLRQGGLASPCARTGDEDFVTPSAAPRLRLTDRAWSARTVPLWRAA